MFDLEYKGGNALVISTKKSSLVIDPKLSLIGLKDLKVKDQIAVATENRFRVADTDAQVVIEGPGEYEVGAVLRLLGILIRPIKKSCRQYIA